MGDVRNQSQAWAIEIEDVEGEYKAPQSASSYLQTLRSGSELSKSKEAIERNVFTGSIGQVKPRTGMFAASGTIACEFRAASTEGGAPEFDKLIKSALGGKRTLATGATLAGSTTSVLKVTDASLWKSGDIVMIKVAGKFHMSPIILVNETDDELTLLVPLADAPEAGTVISAATVYHAAEVGHDPLSITRYYEKKVRQYMPGTRVTSMALSQFATGQTPILTFGLGGLSFEQDLHTQAHNPSYSEVLPPIALSACVFMDGVKTHVNEVSFSLENTLAYKTSTCAPNGRIASTIASRRVTGTLNPYMPDDSVGNFQKFKTDQSFSLFFSARLPKSTEGEIENVIAVYIPNCTITEISDTDADGLIQESISFAASLGANASPEIFVATI
ncbi:MAG: phage tail tube protein [Bdellovibrionales bacterium]|jgi:hypothetical protein|nr:phage tail tube protein [Bdellovibrionales bacterium]